ncbi:hypothetical protein TNIN_272121 [Trichonephila inaurata madagascariensis]|uniref:Uncharacterized protein n=1 Tax=Trichonephila inaurata madagascariensis TaxID=2747483 RepID=A0A8X6I1Z8_9ARAC|nr:hypothetical protein TNIN_272121 [Trichonephila inaurata madagascariensis]
MMRRKALRWFKRIYSGLDSLQLSLAFLISEEDSLVNLTLLNEVGSDFPIDRSGVSKSDVTEVVSSLRSSNRAK